MSKINSPFDTKRIEVPNRGLNRRQFIYTTAIAAGSLALSNFTARARVKSRNDKLDVGIIGTAGKGTVDMGGMAGENIVALCDVDSNKLDKAAAKFPNARKYRDYRVMLEKEKLDATTVTIPDHHHAPAAMRAIKAGMAVYCQKPLTHTVYEARALMNAAREHKVATQMGNQGHSGVGNRQLCEMIWSGVIGHVKEAHCWTNRPIWPQGLQRPKNPDPVPANLDWDIWLGPAPKRPFAAKYPEEDHVKAEWAKRGGPYHPFNWRGWWDFGCGALGDMACHVMDGANWALKLGAPTSVELVKSSEKTSEMAPMSSILKYQFPEREGLPACTLTWYDGGNLPPKPAEMEAERFEESGTLFIGEKGKILCDTYGERPRLLPESSMADYKRPDETIPRVPGNSPYLDFIRACKGGPAACSNFDVAAPFTETVLLGNLTVRLGEKLEWDAVKMKVTNLSKANDYLKAHYRHGWGI